MEQPVISFLLEDVRQLMIYEANLLTGGDEIVRGIQEEFESIMPLFEKIESLREALPKDMEDEIGQIRDVISRAELLIETYAKRVSQINVAKYKKPIYLFKLRRITKELQRIKDDQIPKARDQLSRYVQHQLPWSHAPRGQPAPGSGDVMRGSDPSDIVDRSIPSYLRQCIYYFLLFPAKLEVPARRLTVLWVAEGLVHRKKNDSESIEQIAERYLYELIDLKVVRATKTKRNGKVKACQLKEGTRDMWLRIAEDAKFLRNRNMDIRRLVDHNGSSGDDSFIQIHANPNIADSVPNCRGVISFLSFDTREGGKPGEDIGDFLDKCILAGCFEWLRVLDLERVFRPKLPKTLGELIGLKYLGLRWTYLEELPGFVNKLFNLQLLDVKHTYISVLPKSIWSMQYLRHLYLSEAYRTKFPDRPSRVSLNALQTLWGAFIDENTCVEEGLDTLLDIRKLGLSCRSRASKMSEMSKKLEAVDQWISSLKFLESLRLKSRDEHGKAADLHLSSLEGNRNLSTVYLLGKLQPQVVSEFPVSLTDITLSGSELNLDPMEFLARLPNLQSLRLLAHSVTYNKMRCSRRGFRLLKLLYIWNLEELEEWEAEEGSLPSLEELEFRSCGNLKKSPGGLQHITTLQHFWVTRMPVEFRNDIEKNESLSDKIKRALRFDRNSSENSVGVFPSSIRMTEKEKMVNSG